MVKKLTTHKPHMICVIKNWVKKTEFNHDQPTRDSSILPQCASVIFALQYSVREKSIKQCTAFIFGIFFTKGSA